MTEAISPTRPGGVSLIGASLLLLGGTLLKVHERAIGGGAAVCHHGAKGSVGHTSYSGEARFSYGNQFEGSGRGCLG